MFRVGLWTSMMAGAALTACAGNGKGLGADGLPVAPGSPGAPGGGTVLADFASIQQQVFTPICTACHAGASAPEGLRLDAANSYALLVGVASTEVPSVLRVKPGDPEHSYIIQKLRGIAAVGAQMPFGEAPLPAATIVAISQWITDGALQSAAAATQPQAFRIASVLPQTGESVSGTNLRAFVGFTQALDSTRLDSLPIRLRRLDAGGPDAAAADTAAIPLAIHMAQGNGRELVIAPRAPLQSGDYALELLSVRGTEPADEFGDVLPGLEAGDPLPLTRFHVQEAP